MITNTQTTKGITVEVETFYQAEYSKPVENKFIFAYRITIHNNSSDTVQLLRRHWYIVDSNGLIKEVKGDGVIGQQPILKPNESHQYVSWSHLVTDIGKMYGTYTMLNLSAKRKKEFEVHIPVFQLIAPSKYN